VTSLEAQRSSAPPTLADHARAAQQGDREAFARLYETMYPVVCGVLQAHTDRSHVEDLAQEVFAKALNALPTLRDPEAVGAWLCTMARNEARMRHRRSWRSVPLADQLPADGKNSDLLLDAERALAAIRALPAPFREPLLLRLVHGLSGPEIAEHLGMTHGSLRVNLHRGMTMLRARLGVENL
jgi:RNA polymerase sigma-70 factor (ECF subfamily)